MDSIKPLHLFNGQNPLSVTKVFSQCSLTDIDMNDIGNLEDLLILVFIDEKCGNFKVVIHGGEFTRSINQKKMSEVLQTYIELHSLTNAVDEGISSISK